MTSLLFSRRWRLPVQLGIATLASILSAFVLYMFMAADPSKMIEFVYATILQNDIKAFGMQHAGIKDKGQNAGLVTGGNLRALKNLSGSAVNNLRKSSMVKGLTKKQKQALRRRYKR